MRSADEVLDDHLRRRCVGDLKGDLANNYSDDVLVISKDGIFRGKDGVRHTAQILAEALPDAQFTYDLLRTADGVALLSWSGKGSDGSRTCHGADTFVVRDEKIVVQTIHFELTRP